MLKKIGIICLAIVFTLSIFSSRTSAQSSAALESRISRLESDNFQLRSQISRLESQVAAMSGRSVPSRTPSANIQTPPAPPRVNQQVSSSDPMFNRLATLVIELKERIQVLEAQVAQLRKPRR